MTLNQTGLLLDVVGVLAVGFEAFIRSRGQSRDSIRVGHGANERMLSTLGLCGYLLLFTGFICQFFSAN